jgi:hypothetical protein
MAKQLVGGRMNVSSLAAIAAIAAMAAMAAMAALATAAPAVAAPLSEQMRGGFPGAAPVAAYSAAQITQALQKLLSLTAPPALGEAVSVTPNAPYATDGTHLSFWKPAFLLGTAGDGEAGFNFWDLYVEGHLGVGISGRTNTAALMDCRLYSSGNVLYKVYSGNEGAFAGQGELKILNGHALLLLPARPRTEPVAVELWPNPAHALMGFLGCTIWPFTPAAH